MQCLAGCMRSVSSCSAYIWPRCTYEKFIVLCKYCGAHWHDHDPYSTWCHMIPGPSCIPTSTRLNAGNLATSRSAAPQYSLSLSRAPCQFCGCRTAIQLTLFGRVHSCRVASKLCSARYHQVLQKHSSGISSCFRVSLLVYQFWPCNALAIEVVCRTVELIDWPATKIKFAAPRYHQAVC